MPSEFRPYFAAGLCGFSLIAPGTKFLVTHLRETFVSVVKWSVLFYDIRDDGPNERAGNPAKRMLGQGPQGFDLCATDAVGIIALVDVRSSRAGL
jgi:hypothetical protein